MFWYSFFSDLISHYSTFAQCSKHSDVQIVSLTGQYYPHQGFVFWFWGQTQRLRTYSWLLLRGLSSHCLGILCDAGVQDSCVKGSHEKRLNLRRLFSILLLHIYHLFSTFKVFPFAVFSIWNFPFLKYYLGSLSLPSSINLNISFFINNFNILLQILKKISPRSFQFCLDPGE